MLTVSDVFVGAAFSAASISAVEYTRLPSTLQIASPASTCACRRGLSFLIDSTITPRPRDEVKHAVQRARYT